MTLPPAAGPKLVYLLHADTESDVLREVPSLAKTDSSRPFTIYQGHTGDVGASLADLVDSLTVIV